MFYTFNAEKYSNVNYHIDLSFCRRSASVSGEKAAFCHQTSVKMLQLSGLNQWDAQQTHTDNCLWARTKHIHTQTCRHTHTHVLSAARWDVCLLQQQQQQKHFYQTNKHKHLLCDETLQRTNTTAKQWHNTTRRRRLRLQSPPLILLQLCCCCCFWWWSEDSRLRPIGPSQPSTLYLGFPAVPAANQHAAPLASQGQPSDRSVTSLWLLV